MEISLRMTLLLFLSFCFPYISQGTAAIEGLESSFTNYPPSPTTAPPPLFTSSPPPLLSPPWSKDVHDHSSLHTAILSPILSHLGYNEFAVAARSLSPDSSSNSWSGPFTLFAPSDSSVHTCNSCSVPSLLREHMVPGLFTIEYLRRLAFGTKIETLSSGRCITVTYSKKNGTAAPRVFVGGVAITHPDLFNNGLVVIHGIQGYVSPLSPVSCEVQRISPYSFPIQHDRSHLSRSQYSATTMRLMLRDAILRLRNNGFTMLSLAMKIKYAQLVTLTNMTVFALEDASIFTGSYTYLSNVRFHIVPNQYLTIAELEKLPLGATVPTMERCQDLIVTTEGGTSAPMRINYVKVRVPDVMQNLKIVVHSVYSPFPHVHPMTAVHDDMLPEARLDARDHPAIDRTVNGGCSVLDEYGRCDVISLPRFKPMLDIEDHHM